MENEILGESLLLSDWYIVTNGGNTIFDLSAGIQYRYGVGEEEGATVSVLRFGAPPDALFTFFPLYRGDEAVEFWQRLKERVAPNNLTKERHDIP